MSSGQTSTYQLPYPLLTDEVNVHQDMQSLASQAESVLLGKANLQGGNSFTGDNSINGHLNLSSGKSYKINSVAITTTLPALTWGEVKNGKCTIPIKKLNILKENQVGDIRLEVIAEGNIFVPWEDKFKVRVSKKVTVKVNEQKDYYSRPLKKNVGVKVKVKR